MKVTGTVISTLHTGPFGTISYEHFWKGGPTAYFSRRALKELGYDNPKIGETIVLGNLRLRVVDKEPCFDSYIVGKTGFGGWIYNKLWHSAKWLRWTQTRIILTLYVWGLADFSERQEVTWGQVHLIKRFTK